MESRLCQSLRSLCFKTGWNYAIFWKLNHQAPMMLTLEDAYYDNHGHHGPSENKWSSDKAGRSCDGQFSNNSLGLALENMSDHIYILGEGVVGQVATTGKHLWISSDKYATDVCSLLKYYDGWLTQFSAGIKTIAVVAVVPHGVVQLGSLNSISEEFKLVNHIRDTIFEVQESISAYISSMDCSSCLINVSCRSSMSRNYLDKIGSLDENMKNEKTNIPSSVFSSREELYSAVPQLEGYARKTVIDKNQEPEKSISGGFESLGLLESSFMERLQQLNGNFTSRERESSSGFRDSVVGSENNDDLCSLNMFSGDKSNFYNVTRGANYWEKSWYMPLNIHDSARTSNQPGVLCAAGVSQMKGKMDSKRSLEFHREINHIDKCDPCLNFSAGCELHEALGPAFKKRKTEIVVQKLDEATCNSNLTTGDPCEEHLLEEVVADACRKATNVKHENTVTGSVKSLLTADNVFEPPTNDMHTISLAGYSFHQSSIVEENTHHYIPTSATRDGRRSKGFSSASYSKCNEQMERPQELFTISRRKARHGKKSRRRPRDRQLIEDRIKELRELVPNGSKCSIDSLLERTIKHMLFMQCTTKQSDKLDKCAESKLVDNEIGTRGSSSYEQGSCWAMEVGDHFKILPVTVENIDTSGQMLIKMLCEDCSPLLEIVKTIRSLGLTILKSATEVYDGKILICYVVEGKNNRNMHRTDVLRSLLQILEQKAYI